MTDFCASRTSGGSRKSPRRRMYRQSSGGSTGAIFIIKNYWFWRWRSDDKCPLSMLLTAFEIRSSV